jgi:predicted TPR repeat methyltransferase
VTLAEAYMAAGKMEPAAEAYRQAVARKPAWQGPGADAAETLLTAGRWDDAVAAYQEIVGPQ